MKKRMCFIALTLALCLAFSAALSDTSGDFTYEVMEDGSVLFKLNGESWSGTVSAVRRYMDDVGLTLERDGKLIASSRGEVQFSDDYLGGICVMDLSVLAEKGDVLSLDLLPEMAEEGLCEYLEGRIPVCGTAEQLLSGCLNRALALLALKDCGFRPAASAASLGEMEVRELARTVKALRFPVNGVPGFARAQTCLGGVLPGSVDGETLGSREKEGLFFCGELLGVTGRCGGYNLAWAWASGRVAGRNAALR